MASLPSLLDARRQFINSSITAQPANCSALESSPWIHVHHARKRLIRPAARDVVQTAQPTRSVRIVLEFDTRRALSVRDRLLARQTRRIAARRIAADRSEISHQGPTLPTSRGPYSERAQSAKHLFYKADLAHRAIVARMAELKLFRQHPQPFLTTCGLQRACAL